jgi:hypothetical protein
MMVSVLSASSAELAVGQMWRIRVAGGATAPTLSVMLPDDTTLTPAVTFEADGRDDEMRQLWLAEVLPVDPGRYVASVTDGEGGNALLLAYVSTVTTSAAMPSGDTLDDWLGAGEHSWTEPELADAMRIALDAQRRVCRVSAVYPDDLREAVHRRAALYLYRRKQLTAQARDDGDFDSSPTLPPGRDFEVRSLEAPFRKTPIG